MPALRGVNSVIFLSEGGRLRARAHHGAISILGEGPTDRGWVAGRAFVDREPVHVHDLQGAADEFPNGSARALRFGHRTTLGIPLLREDEAIGTLLIRRDEVRPFTDKQIALLTTFARQAVIAIENARLFDEAQARTRDLSEALEQQTATSEVLRVISSSPGELEPVFQAMLENAVRICEAKFGTLFRYDGNNFHRAAWVGTPAALVEFQKQRGAFRPDSAGVLARVLRRKQIAHSADSAAEPNPGVATTLGGARSIVGVPMLKDNELVGAIVIYRQEVRPFTDKQIELVTNFAAQAVIAIENTRLLNELRQRTTDLSEALEYQTATTDVLKVISQSGAELGSVLDTLVSTAARICVAESGFIFRLHDGLCRMVASFGIPEEYREFQARNPIAPGRGTLAGRTILERRPVHIEDAAADPEYTRIEAVQLGNQRTMLGVPLVRDGVLIGVITLARSRVEAFTEKEIALVATFADQAVIAIENDRLLNELRESLQQQTATADVLKVISRSAFDLQTVLDTLVESAARLCDAYDALIPLRDGKSLVFGAHHGPIPFDLIKRPITRAWTNGRAVVDRKPVHVPDLTTAGDEFPEGRADALRMGHRTVLSVPLLRDDDAIGSLSVRRTDVRPFTDKQIELVQTFADQAVIAIENARLFDEVKARTRDLSKSLQQQTATADILTVISNSLDDTQPVFDAIVQSGLKLFADATIQLSLADGDKIRLAAVADRDPARADAMRRIFPIPLTREYMNGVAILDGRVVDVPDAENAPPELAIGARHFLATGNRAVTIMPMMRGQTPIGALQVVRLMPGPLSDKQREVLKTFANQAVIAIENTRLLHELRRIPAAADGDCRRAQSDQPLGVRSANGARYACRIGRPTLPGGRWTDRAS